MEIEDAAKIKDKIKSSWMKPLLVISLIGNIALTGLFLFSCNTFKPVMVKGFPPECNFSLNVIKLYYQSKDKSGAVNSIGFCNRVFKEKRCMMQVFKKEEIDYSKPMKLINYYQCIAK